MQILIQFNRHATTLVVIVCYTLINTAAPIVCTTTFHDSAFTEHRRLSDTSTLDAKPATFPIWRDVRRNLFSSRQFWPKLASASLLQQYLRNDVFRGQPEIPIDIEAHEIDEDQKDELEVEGGARREWDSHNSILGLNKNIFTFWDDPACDFFVFPSGLYVCGDAQIRGFMTIVSGMNVSSVLVSRHPKAMHLHNRCSIDPAKLLSHKQPWCFMGLTIRSADVMVIDRAEITATLYVESVRVEAGAFLFVGIRGMIYANERIVGSMLSKYADEYAALDSELQKRHEDDIYEESKKNFANNKTQQVRQRVTLQQFHDIETRSTQSVVETPKKQRKKNAFFFTLSPRYERLAIAETELESLKCPIIDSMGSIWQLQRAVNGSLERKTVFQDNEDDGRNSDNDDDNNNNIFDQQSQFKSLITSRTKSSSIKQINPFGPNLPYLDFDTTIGDLISIGQLLAGNAAFVWIFGNFVGTGVVADEAAQVHIHCGHFYINITSPAGITGHRSAIITAGGLLESVTSRIALQRASQMLMAGSIVATKFIQVFRTSQCTIIGEVLTGVIAVNEASELNIGGMTEIQLLLDISDGSTSTLFGSLGLGLLQVLDGSTFKIWGEDVIIEDSLIVDSKAKLEINGGSLLAHNSIHVANNSELLVPEGDVVLQSHGSIRIIGSKMLLGGDCLAPRGSVIIALGSQVMLQGSLKSAGLTASDAYIGRQDTEKKFGKDGKPPQSSISSSWVIDPSEKNRSGVDIGNVLSNSDLKEKKDEEVNEQNSSIGGEKNSSKLEKKKPMPALYVESSELIIEGALESLNSWTDITRKSVVIIGLGILTMNANTTLLTVRLGSSLKVLNGSLLPGAALVLTRGGEVIIKNGTIYSSGPVEVRERSILIAAELQVNGDLLIDSDATVSIKNRVISSGNLLSVARSGNLRCAELRQKHGDLFVEDSGSLVASHGNIWVYGSIVAQDWGHILAAKGNIITVQGDVIAENFASILAPEGVLVLYSAQLNLKEQMQLKNSSFVTLADKYLPIGAARKTADAIIKSLHMLPEALSIDTYVQEVPISFLNSIAPQISTDVEAKIILEEKDEGQFEHDLIGIKHGTSYDKTKAMLQERKYAEMEMHEPSKWDSLVLVKERSSPEVSAKISREMKENDLNSYSSRKQKHRRY